METRQELILRFMTALAATEYHAAKIDNTISGQEQEKRARDVYLSAATLADAYLSRI